ncbi:MAG: ArsB/NhaD family transporter [Anaerolineaceae bacterium]|jgi:Na+/H+ antiporter NhaD/arsenite permease-like protein
MADGIIALIIFGITLFLIFSEKLHRTIAGLLGATAMVIAGKIFGFYEEADAIQAIDLSTIGLLLGMMVMVALLEPTGIFEYIAIFAARLSKGKTVRLLVLLGTITTVLSMFLDNVTTVILIAPVTILICEILGLNPSPFLIAEALLSNTGGIATLIGDPPNVLIAAASGFTFNDFLTHSLPIVLFAWLSALLLLVYLFRGELSKKPAKIEVLEELEPKEALKNPAHAKRVLIILGAAIVLFFFEELLNITPAFIALSAATLSLIWIRPTINEVLAHIEWSVLLFFAALFVMIGGLESTGILQELAHSVLGLSTQNPMLFSILLLWMVAILSAFLDNIPVTIALIPVIQSLAASGVNVNALWWALAFGAGLGGNGTIIGSTANIVVASLSERTRNPITVKLWNKRGLPVMLATCAVTTILFMIAYPYLSK